MPLPTSLFRHRWQNSDIVIPAGSSKGAITINVGDYTDIANGSEYIIPVKFSLTSGLGAELTS